MWVCRGEGAGYRSTETEREGERGASGGGGWGAGTIMFKACQSERRVEAEESSATALGTSTHRFSRSPRDLVT